VTLSHKLSINSSTSLAYPNDEKRWTKVEESKRHVCAQQCSGQWASSPAPLLTMDAFVSGLQLQPQLQPELQWVLLSLTENTSFPSVSSDPRQHWEERSSRKTQANKLEDRDPHKEQSELTENIPGSIMPRKAGPWRTTAVLGGVRTPSKTAICLTPGAQCGVQPEPPTNK
jgi:hypothetical protein